MTVPTLILIGELDDWTPARSAATLPKAATTGEYRAQKGEGIPIEIIVYPGAYHDFDVPQSPARPRSCWAITSNSTRRRRDQSIDALRKFLYATIGGKEKQP